MEDKAEAEAANKAINYISIIEDVVLKAVRDNPNTPPESLHQALQVFIRDQGLPQMDFRDLQKEYDMYARKKYRTPSGVRLNSEDVPDRNLLESGQKLLIKIRSQLDDQWMSTINKGTHWTASIDAMEAYKI